MPRLAFVAVGVGLVALAAATGASAEERASGSLVRGAGQNGIVADLDNTSTAGEAFSGLRLEIPAMDSAANLTHSGPPGSNCDTIQKAVICVFNPPWRPGEPLSVRFDTSPRVPDNAGGSLFVCQLPCQASDERGPFVISGPSASQAILVVEKTSEGTMRQESYGIRQGFEYSVKITNTGTEDAVNVRLRDVLPAGTNFGEGRRNAGGGPTFSIVDPSANLFDPNIDSAPDMSGRRNTFLFGRHCRQQSQERTLNCMLPLIGPRTSITVFFSVEAFTTGVKRNVADVTADNAPPAGSNPVEDTITQVGDSSVDADEIFGPDEFVEVEGTAEPMNPEGEFRAPGEGGPVAEIMSFPAGVFAAQSIRALSRLARVEVAMRRVRGRQCLWLRSARGGFRRIKAVRGKCNRGIWSRARGTRRWRFRLRRTLPPGKYIAYSRAVNRAGAHERKFSRADGNLLTFKITRGRR